MNEMSIAYFRSYFESWGKHYKKIIIHIPEYYLNQIKEKKPLDIHPINLVKHLPFDFSISGSNQELIELLKKLE